MLTDADIGVSRSWKAMVLQAVLALAPDYRFMLTDADGC
jgi:hypothetical protein